MSRAVGSRRNVRVVVSMLCVVAGVLLFSGAAAQAATKYPLVRELSETPAGPFENPAAVAVGQAFGETYVVDQGRAVVDEFDASGLFMTELTGTPSGPFGKPEGVAVDATGDVFVVDSENAVVDEFDTSGTFVRQISGTPVAAPVNGPFGGLNRSIAVDQSSGDLYVGDSVNNVVDEFDSSGLYIRQLAETPASGGVGGPFGGIQDLAVDGAGNLYVADSGSLSVDEFDSSGTFMRRISGVPSGAPIGGAFGFPLALAVNQSSGDLYVSDIATTPPVVDQFDSSGIFKAQLQFPGADPVGLAVDAMNNLYVADNETRTVKVIGPGEIVPDVSTGAASDATETTATLGGNVDPDGPSLTSCELEYVSEAALKELVGLGFQELVAAGLSAEAIFAYGSRASCEHPSAAEIFGTSPVVVHVDVSGLMPRMGYHFRLVAANANGSTDGSAESFTTPEHPTIDGEAVSNVEPTGVMLDAELNPGGLPTSYQFEYGTSKAYGNEVPLPVGNVGSSFDDKTVNAYPRELSPGTLYHYRVVATNTLGTVKGLDQTFTTQSSNSDGGFALPDSRVWEMVSPQDKYSSLIVNLSGGVDEAGVVQAAVNGDAITYLTIEPIVADPAGNSNESQIISRRSSEGWETEDIATPHEDDEGARPDHGGEYKAFSPDLTLALVSPFGDTPLLPNVPDHEGDVYVRNNLSGAYALLTETNGGSAEIYKVTSGWYMEQLGAAGTSSTGSYRAFMSNENLTGYNNRDANSGEPDEEVFLENTITKHLVCASCNPTGARPVGVFDENRKGLFVDGAGEWTGHWLAGNIPGPTRTDASEPGDYVREPRFLDPATGRLFFNSSDALVPSATNGKENVYEYEPKGVGTCTSSTASASEVFENAENQGEAGACISLISAGTSSTESEFLDASASGDDVFFLTSAQLVSKDRDNAYDIYDAHVCSEASPCPSSTPESLPVCDTGDSCKPAPTSQPAIYGPPPSATFSGAGNLAALVSKPVFVSKVLTRGQKLAKALKACKKQRRAKRKACKATARKKYGPTSKAKTKKKSKAKANKSNRRGE